MDGLSHKALSISLMFSRMATAFSCWNSFVSSCAWECDLRDDADEGYAGGSGGACVIDGISDEEELLARLHALNRVQTVGRGLAGLRRAPRK